ncbi:MULTISPECIES: glutamine amidotransferase [Edaphosphingomonas]|uniref:Glutamine amidotransferase n=2 Tax=Edaphosphingomonas TaxID=3423724 RepID=A0A2T4HVX8_9SPHN|nr:MULTISPECIES: glutamine amidotransferase [Sphingomonas]OHT21189.1 glutamine amidotransferase [Sphingomonas haloaromaticamans]PTD19951.1 glutamine amidotransferase [Sphingomonas fennica]
MKRALVIRHVPVEGVAGFRAPIEAAGFIVDRIDVTDPAFPETDMVAPDLVVMMGGPMGVYETDRHPWIACQIRRLGERLAADRPTLGVCLGAQMMAAALGARVYPGGRQEVGFAPVSLNGKGADSPLRHVEGLPMLHWHGDTFDLPGGTELLASTDHYAHQAFRRGANILALQFHAEMGEDPRFENWLEKWPDAIAAAGGTADELRAHHDAHGPNAVAAGRRMIAEWLEGLRL